MSDKISAANLRKKNVVDLSKSTADFSRYTFWYYTSVSTADKILESECFFVNNLKNMNDKNEEKLHEKEKDNIFALCLCNSNSEKIPMWYLYAGICGDGMRIGLTPSVMIKFLNKIRVYPVVGYEAQYDRELILGRDVQIQFGWVYYKDGAEICYKNKWYSVRNLDDFLKDNYFVKDYPWNYEKEFRVVIRNISDSEFEKLAVRFPSEMLEKIKITCAPECKEIKFEGAGFAKYYRSKIACSDLQINMNLLGKNKERIIGELDKLIDKSDIKIIEDKITEIKGRS